MDRYAGVLRTEEGIDRMLEEIEKTRTEEMPNLMMRDKTRAYNYELRDALEMPFRLDVEEMAATAAGIRKESRWCSSLWLW